MIKRQEEKGAIAIFVLVTLLFMIAFLIISFASNINKYKTLKEQLNIIGDIYTYSGGDEGAYNKAYTDLRNKNKQTLTAYSENSSALELTKTFDEKMSNYRIYGNSVQDGTPSPTSPVEIKSVGDAYNLLNPNATLENIRQHVAYLGINIPNINKNYTLQIKLKEGKNIPTGIYFGFVYFYNETGAAGAYWLTTDSGLNKKYGDGTYALANFNPSTYYASGVACFPGNQATWDSIMDAFEITLVEGSYNSNNIPDYIPYGKYKLPIKLTNEKGESTTSNILLNEPLRKVGDVADYIDFKTGKVVRKIKETTITGDEYWAVYHNAKLADGSWRYYGFYRGGLDGVSSRLKGLSNMSPYVGEYYSEKNAMWLGVGNIMLYWIKNDYYDSSLADFGLSNFKERLNSYPLKIYYESRAGIPDESINLPELQTYEDYTKIEVLTEVVPSKIEAEYIGYTLD